MTIDETLELLGNLRDVHGGRKSLEHILLRDDEPDTKIKVYCPVCGVRADITIKPCILSGLYHCRNGCKTVVLDYNKR